jgi:GNAT superfamily N-acetyltransferase
MTQRRVRLCMKDLYHGDVVEMIERETRKYQLWTIETPGDPDFEASYDLLWDCFGPAGEMERKDVIRDFLRYDSFKPNDDGTFMRYFLMVAKDKDGQLRGARDGTVLINPRYAPNLCLIYLSHIFMRPEARGTVLSYWLRIAPVELAMQYLADLHARGLLRLPDPEAPGKYFGMHIDLAAEMEYFTPEERISWQRILFYGRGGFDAINPRHFPYRQPDFRDPEVIRRTGNMPVPFMLLLRRMGRERFATMPIDEARAVVRLLYDDFSTHCESEFLDTSLQLVLDRLDVRAERKSYVELVPLPTGVKDLHRLKRLFRHQIYTRYYPEEPDTLRYLDGGIRERLAANPSYLDDEIARIAGELEARPKFVYGTRERGFTWEGLPEQRPADLPADFSITGEWPSAPESVKG